MSTQAKHAFEDSKHKSQGGVTYMPRDPEAYSAALAALDTTLAILALPEVAAVLNSSKRLDVEIAPNRTEKYWGNAFLNRIQDPGQRLFNRVDAAAKILPSVATELGADHPLSRLCSAQSTVMSRYAEGHKGSRINLDLGTLEESADRHIDDLMAQLAGTIGLFSMTVIGTTHDGAPYQYGKMYLVNPHDPETASRRPGSSGGVPANG
jgi:hypothetical protein